MKIIIPMSGIGLRFLNAGYKDPKPLISIEGKPIIQHVIERFSKDDDFIFICNEDHLTTTPMRDILLSLAPKSKIYSICPHKKGPVFAVSQAFDHITDDEQCIVNYCDFSWRWDYMNFRETMKKTNCDGCVVSYKGFHPHLLHPNFYAGLADDGKNWMKEIREKYSFTKSKMDSYQSSGTYYFKTGKILKENFQSLMDKNINLNGEFYVSSVFQELVDRNLKVYIYEIPYMLQWGTPEDFEEYKYWSEVFYEK